MRVTYHTLPFVCSEKVLSSKVFPFFREKLKSSKRGSHLCPSYLFSFFFSYFPEYLSVSVKCVGSEAVVKVIVFCVDSQSDMSNLAFSKNYTYK